MTKTVKIEIDENIVPIDKEEKEIFEEINWQDFVVFTKDEAKNKTLKQLNEKAKSQQISMKMPRDLLVAVKKKAAQEGLPYQTYIKHILHKAVMEE